MGIKKLGGPCMEDKLIFEVDGNCGQIIKVYEDYCIFTKSNKLIAAINGFSTKGDEKFYYKDITAVHFKNTGFNAGYLKFESGLAKQGTTFTFHASSLSKRHKELQVEMPPVYEYIQKRVEELKSNSGSSSADEILKYKQLLDCGAITQEEYDKKKQELLDI